MILCVGLLNFLSITQEIGLQLIRVGRLEEVAQLLSKPEYVPLRPALLLLGWDVYVAEGSGKELTEAIWPSQVGDANPYCVYTPNVTVVILT